MKSQITVLMSFVSISILFILVTWPAFGSPPLQNTETAQALTIEALIGERFTQTAAVLNETATKQAQVTSTPTPDLNATAEALFNDYLTATAGVVSPEVAPDSQHQAAHEIGTGWQMIELGEYYEAIDQFSYVIELDPLWAEGYVGRGLAYTTIYDFDKALVDIQKAVEIDSNDADLYGGWLCYLLIATDQYLEGLAACDQAIDLNPRYAAVYNNRGYGYEHTGRFEEAIADYTRAIFLNPDESSYYLNRQNVYDTLDNFDYYTMDSYLVNGMNYFDGGNLSGALREFTKAINFEGYYTTISAGSQALAYYHRGRIYQEFDNPDAALDDYMAAIANAPDFTPAYINRAELLYAQGDTQTALGSYQRVFQLDADYPPSYLSRAQIYDAEGEYNAAMTDYALWMRYNQTRDIVWDRFVSGEDFPLFLAPGWVYILPFTGVTGQLIEANASAYVSFDLEPPKNDDTKFDGESAALPYGLGKYRFQPGDPTAEPLIIVFNSAGKAIAVSNNVSADNQNAFLRVILPTDDSYTVAVVQVGKFGGSVQMNLNIGSVLSGSDLTATVAAYTSTPTTTPTNTFTPTFTPTLTRTPTNTPTPTPTLDLAVSDFQFLGELRVEDAYEVTWRDNNTVISISVFDGIVAHTASNLREKVELGPYNISPSVFIASPDGHYLLTGDESIRVDNAETGEFITWLNGHGEYVARMAFRGDSRLMVSGDADGRVFIWDMTTFERIGSFTTPEKRLMDMDYSDDGEWVAAMDFDSRVTLWDVSDPSNPRSFATIGYQSYDTAFSMGQLLTFSPDSNLLAIANGNDVVLWDMQTLREIGRLEHADIVNSVDISADNMVLAAGLVDGTVRLWHIPSRTEIATLAPDNAVTIMDARFSPDGQKIAIRDYDSRAWIWGIPSRYEQNN